MNRFRDRAIRIVRRLTRHLPPPVLGSLRSLGVMAAVSGLALSLSCGGSTSPDEEPAPLQSPIAFLVDFATAYTFRDSTGYAALLDSGYAFELIPGEIEEEDSTGTLDRVEELRIAGNMFEKRVDAEGRSLRDLALRFILKGTVLDETPYPGKPSEETWLRVTTFADLLVVVNDPNEPLGYFPLTVASEQIFVLRRDPAGSGRLLVVRQIDRPAGGKAAGSASSPAAADLVSWGSVKRFFRW
jgi:hypothetical protein